MDASYLYSGIDGESKALNDELERLGGGDARIIGCEVHCIIDDRRGVKDAQTIWNFGNAVGVRDVHLGHEASVSESMTYYPVSSATTLAGLLHSPTTHLPVIGDVVDWCIDGFNACIMGYGARGSGKTLAMFGACEDPHKHQPTTSSSSSSSSSSSWCGGFPQDWQPATPCVSSTLLKTLFERIDSSQLAGDWDEAPTVALSCWALRGNDIIDLCSASSANASPLAFAMVECPDPDTAQLVLTTARLRCHGGLAYDSSMTGQAPPPVQEHTRAHIFCRLVVHGRRRGRMTPQLSHVHLVDLVGTVPSDWAPGQQALEEREAEARRRVASQLGSLVRVLGEMRASTKVAGAPLRAPAAQPNLRMTSARDSKLTMLLAPLLQGNSRTCILLHVKDGTRNFGLAKASLASFKGMVDVASACHVAEGVSRSALPLKAASTVLSVFTDPNFSDADNVLSHTQQHVTQRHVAPERESRAFPHNVIGGKTHSPVPATFPAFDAGDVHRARVHIPAVADTRERSSRRGGVSTGAVPDRMARLMGDFKVLLAEVENKLSDGSESSIGDDRGKYDDNNGDSARSSNRSTPSREAPPKTMKKKQGFQTKGIMYSTSWSTDDSVSEGGRDSLASLRSSLAAAREELLEVRAQHAVDLGDAKQEVLRLKAVARQLAAQSSIGASGALQGLEEDVDKLTKDNEALRGRNLELELRSLEGTLTAQGGGGGDVAAELGRKLRALQRDAGSRRQELSTLRAALRARDNDLHAARTSVANLENAQREAGKERSRCLAQMAAMRQRLRFLEGELKSRDVSEAVIGHRLGNTDVGKSGDAGQGEGVVVWGSSTTLQPGNMEPPSQHRPDTLTAAPEVVRSPAKAEGIAMLRARAKEVSKMASATMALVSGTDKGEAPCSPPPKLLMMPSIAKHHRSSDHDHSDWLAAGQARGVQFMSDASHGIVGEESTQQQGEEMLMVDMSESASVLEPASIASSAVERESASVWDAVVKQAGSETSSLLNQEPPRAAGPDARLSALAAESEIPASGWTDTLFLAAQDMHESPPVSPATPTAPTHPQAHSGLTPLMRLVNQDVDVAGVDTGVHSDGADVGIDAAAGPAPPRSRRVASAGRSKPPPLPFEKDSDLFASIPPS